MGQKVSPVGMRVGINRDWESTWYADKAYSKFLNQDIQIRKYLENHEKVKEAVLSKVLIKRVNDSQVDVTAKVLKTGILVGQDNKVTEEISKKIAKITNAKVTFNVAEVENPDLDATLVAKSIAAQLEARASFRMVQKKALQRVMKAGAKGIKTSVSGRLGGADIARAEGYSDGVVPLHTLREDIDFAIAEAMTTYGKLGVKVWICRDSKKAKAEGKGE